MANGALSAKTKQLIALAIAATRERDGCIAAHARAAVREDASKEEVAEAMGVVIAMNGGPGTVWGPRVLAAFEEFDQPGPSPIRHRKRLKAFPEESMSIDRDGYGYESDDRGVKRLLGNSHANSCRYAQDALDRTGGTDQSARG